MDRPTATTTTAISKHVVVFVIVEHQHDTADEPEEPKERLVLESANDERRRSDVAAKVRVDQEPLEPERIDLSCRLDHATGAQLALPVRC